MSMPFLAFPDKSPHRSANAQPCSDPTTTRYDRQFAAVSQAIEEARLMVATAAGVPIDKVVIRFTG